MTRCLAGLPDTMSMPSVCSTPKGTQRIVACVSSLILASVSACSVPMAEEEAAVLDALLELIVIVTLINPRVTIGLGFLEHVLLDVLQKLLHALNNAVNRHGFFLQRVAAHYFKRVVLKVTTTHHEANRAHPSTHSRRT